MWSEFLYNDLWILSMKRQVTILDIPTVYHETGSKSRIECPNKLLEYIGEKYKR
jgi:hypothetical protein